MFLMLSMRRHPWNMWVSCYSRPCYRITWTRASGTACMWFRCLESKWLPSMLEMVTRQGRAILGVLFYYSSALVGHYAVSLAHSRWWRCFRADVQSKLWDPRKLRSRCTETVPGAYRPQSGTHRGGSRQRTRRPPASLPTPRSSWSPMTAASPHVPFADAFLRQKGELPMQKQQATRPQRQRRWRCRCGQRCRRSRCSRCRRS